MVIMHTLSVVKNTVGSATVTENYRSLMAIKIKKVTAGTVKR